MPPVQWLGLGIAETLGWACWATRTAVRKLSGLWSELRVPSSDSKDSVAIRLLIEEGVTSVTFVTCVTSVPSVSSK